MNRPDISRLKKNRNIFLKIGLLISLCMIIFAFNFTVYEYKNTDYKAITIDEDLIDPVIRTPHESKPKFVPPVLEPSENIFPDDHEFIEDPIPEPIDPEIKVDTQIVRPQVRPVFFEKPKVPEIISVEKATKKVPDIFERVEEMPRFPGCEDSELSKEEKKVCADQTLLKYIYSKIKYPRIAVETGVEGTVLINFIVEKTGEITDISIIKEIGAGCGNEVVRVVKGMPKWMPGKQRGKEVRVRFKIPVKFSLQ